jgi:DNA-binding CsgD family transcriptional regulator
MKTIEWFRSEVSRRATIFAAIILVQALCGLFFVSDIVTDWESLTSREYGHLAIETLATVALAACMFASMVELRQLLTRMAAMDDSLRVSRGDMAVVIESFFERWKLTPSERDVALMVLKGFDNEAISELRGTAQGTVRAQCTKIYAKAGVDGRAQLLSIFMEELLDGGVRPDHLDRDVSPATAGAALSRAPAAP